jgi:hypothetical protein
VPGRDSPSFLFPHSGFSQSVPAYYKEGCGISRQSCVPGIFLQRKTKRLKHEKSSVNRFANSRAVSNLPGTFPSSLGSTPYAVGRARRPKQPAPDCSRATKQYLDINNATAAGMGPSLVASVAPTTGPWGSTMSIPICSTEADATQPPALIYETSNGQMKLVGGEFIVDAATWRKSNSGPWSWKVKGFSMSTAQIGSTFRHSSNFTSGCDATTRRARSVD